MAEQIVIVVTERGEPDKVEKRVCPLSESYVLDLGTHYVNVYAEYVF